PVVIVSTELDEVTQLADRIAVMYGGRILGIVPGDEDRDVLGLMMAGYSVDAARAAVAAGARTTDSQLADEGDIAGAVLVVGGPRRPRRPRCPGPCRGSPAATCWSW